MDGDGGPRDDRHHADQDDETRTAHYGEGHAYAQAIDHPGRRRRNRARALSPNLPPKKKHFASPRAAPCAGWQKARESAATTKPVVCHRTPLFLSLYE